MKKEYTIEEIKILIKAAYKAGKKKKNKTIAFEEWFEHFLESYNSLNK